MLPTAQKLPCGNIGRNGTAKTAAMQPSTSHAGGFFRNSAGDKKKHRDKGFASWITPFTAHGKAKVPLSHVLQTALPTTQKCKPVIHSSTTPDGGGENRTPSFFHS